MAVCKCFINSGLCFQWIILHEVLFFGFECLGSTGCQYVFHMKYSWLDNRNATSWGKKKKTPQKQNPKPDLVSQKILWFFFSMAPKKTKQANETAFSAPSSSPQSLALWLSHSSGLQQAQVQSPSKWSASTRSVHICSAEGCTAACSGASPGR